MRKREASISLVSALSGSRDSSLCRRQQCASVRQGCVGSTGVYRARRAHKVMHAYLGGLTSPISFVVRGNEFTPRAVRAILSNPVYCGDVVFHKAGRLVRDHHEGIVDRKLWETVNGGRVTVATADTVDIASAADRETTEQEKAA